MEQVLLSSAFRIGRILDALEHLPVTYVTPPGLAPIRSLAIEPQRLSDPASLRLRCRQALKADADALVVVGAPRTALNGPPPPLPVISLSPEATVDEISERLLRLEEELDADEHLSEGHARDRIVDIVDRAAVARNGHIIVEDDHFQMVAYSQLSIPVDEARQSAVLQRQMPPHLLAVFNAQGVLASLLSGEDVVQTLPDPEKQLGPRLVVAIRYHGRLVGTVWFARENPPFNDADVEALLVAARQMSVILAGALRERHDQRLRRDDAVLDLLQGRRVNASVRVLREHALDTRMGAHVMTLAQAAPEGSTPTSRLPDLRTLATSAIRSVRAEATTVFEGDRLHILHFGCDESEATCTAQSTRRLAFHICDQLRRVDVEVAAGIGQHIEQHQRIVDSAQDADRVLSGLLTSGSATIATARDAWATLLLDKFLRVPGMPDDTLPPALAQLFGSDSQREREQLQTVRVALDHWGDIAETARHLHVHQNTVRYRLQRFSDVSGIDLSNPTNRLSLWILLVHRALLENEESPR